MSERDDAQTPDVSQPPPPVAVASIDPALPAERTAIGALVAEIDLGDSQAIVHFGSTAQSRVAALSDDMLDRVRNKDTGPAGEALNRMIGAIRGFDLDDIDPNRKPSLVERLFGAGKPVARFLQRYEQVREQIDAIGDDLERHKTTLLTDIASLDRLYDATLDGFHQLERFLAAGEEKLRQVDAEEVPALERAANASGAMLDAQKLRDLRAARDGLERRLHDLRLTRQVVMQALPSIRLVQENDRGLVNKIVSTTANTLPLWRQQLAQAVTIQRSREAAAAVRDASDLTNELLEANARNLKLGNAEARKELERGVFDIEAVERANQALVETIEESLQIADEGRARRAEATARLEALESELRTALAAARATPARD
ncbi:MAG: toxic anion resistance protein [Ectothiorhodospiraceae bacterium]|nr:toxic anion resistance protein [Ectothiorhodospiraceae bacterium]